MKRTTPMKRTAFKPKGFAPRPVKSIDYTPKPRRPASEFRVEGARAALSMPVPRPKDNPIQHEAYMALVRELPCARCGRYWKGLIQFCHADDNGGRGGKGMGIKSDCRRGWPGCGPHGDDPGCHWLVGTSGVLSKQERHEFETGAGGNTRAAIRNAGKWPASLPPWPGDAAAELTRNDK